MFYIQELLQFVSDLYGLLILKPLFYNCKNNFVSSKFIINFLKIKYKFLAKDKSPDE